MTRALRDARDAYLIVAFIGAVVAASIWIGRAL